MPALRLLAQAFLVLVAFPVAFTGVAWADAGAPALMTRMPFLSLGAALVVGGLGIASLHRGWWELPKLGRGGRVLGVLVAAIGSFVLIYGSTASPPSAGGDGLPWQTDVEAAWQASASSGRPLMVDFRADWCVACDELEAEVFHHPDVAPTLIDDFVILKVDFEAPTEANERLRKRFKVSGLPHIAFVGPDDTHLESASFTGKVDVPEFKSRLEAARSGASVSSEDTFARTLGEGGLLAALGLVFVAGLLASLTPCVYPLIPITIGVFGARDSDSRLQSFGLSLVYVLGIAVTYSILGVIAAIFGTVFGGAMQNPWVLGSIAVVFTVLGLSSLGLFEMRLPGNLQTRLSQVGGNGIGGAFVMGLFAGIIAAPCVGPIVAGVLLYVAQQQDVVLGVVLLMTFAFGMGILFIVLGTFSGLLARIPKSGGWMEGVKIAIGAIFLGVALYYARFLVPPVADIADAVWVLVG